jgi:copper chaperone CopZ
MKTFYIEAPAMYGDHHVVEVRRILLALPGIIDVYASSAFHSIEVTFSPDQASEADIMTCLEEAGYLGDVDAPMESGAPAYHSQAGETFYRQTSTFETIRHAVSFTQKTPFQGRPIWPCPGMGVVRKEEE